MKMLPHLIQRYGNVVFLAYMIGGVTFLVLIDSVFNGGFTFAMKILCLPAAVLIFGTMWWHRVEFYRITRSRWKPWLVATVLYPLALMLSWPYLMAVNAITSGGETISYYGPIVHKWVSGGRSRAHQIVVHDQATGQRVTLTVNTGKYDTLSIGDVWRETFSVGGFGIPFRWKWDRR